MESELYHGPKRLTERSGRYVDSFHLYDQRVGWRLTYFEGALVGVYTPRMPSRRRRSYSLFGDGRDKISTPSDGETNREMHSFIDENRNSVQIWEDDQTSKVTSYFAAHPFQVQVRGNFDNNKRKHGIWLSYQEDGTQHPKKIYEHGSEQSS